MTAGLPGTGIGGLFYILMCIFMPFVHIYRVIKGENKKHHFKTLLVSVVLSVSILLSLYGEAKLLIWLVDGVQSANKEAFVLTSISPALVFLPFIILFSILVILQMLRLFFHGFRRKSNALKEISQIPLHGEKVA